MSVEQMTNANGKGVANQFIVTTAEGKMFQSYSSNIALIPNDGSPIRLGADWKASTTTAKYRNQFLGTTTKEIMVGIKNGDYIIDEDL